MFDNDVNEEVSMKVEDPIDMKEEVSMKVEDPLDIKEEVSMNVEDPIDIKKEVCIKVVESIDTKDEIPEAFSFPPVKNEDKVRLWVLCVIVVAHAFRVLMAP